MADTLVHDMCDYYSDEKNGLWGPYWISTSVAVIVFIDQDGDISFARTTNSGVDWAITEIVAGAIVTVACWFDQETPGDNGTLIHVAWLDSIDEKVYYRTIDIDDGSLGAQRTLKTCTNINTYGNQNRIGITKTVGGNLLVAYLAIYDGIGFFRSVDAGANWTSRTDVFEDDEQRDHILLYPADMADNNDVCAIYWDASADEISIKMYDDSEDAWVETSVAGSMTEDLTHINMDAAVRHSDGAILLAAHSNDDAVVDDLMMWEILPDDIDAPAVTAKTNIFTNQGESAQAAVLIDQNNDDVYVAHLKGGMWGATVDVVFHKSDDGMGSWGVEQTYNEAVADDIRRAQGGRTVGSSGGRVQWSFYNDDLFDIFVNLVNDIEIVAAGGTTYYSTPSGSQTNTGALLRKTVASRAGALTFAGNMLSAVGKMFAGAVTTAGTLTEKVAIVLSGALSSIGTLTRKIPKILIGVASLGGILSRKTSKVFAGAASFVGSTAKKTIRSLAGESTSSGAVSALGRLGKLLAGTLTSAGALTSRARKVLSGASDLAGAVVRTVMNKLAGGLTGSGVLTKKMARGFAGTLTSAGNLAKRVATFLTGALTGDGILTGRVRKVLDGALTSIGALTGKARKALTGALASVGTLERKAAHALSGALFLDGSIIKKVSSRLAGVLNLSGVMVKSMLESLMGAVTPGGTLSTKGRKLLAGVATSAGMMTKSVAHGLAGGLTSSGTIIKGATQSLTGAITIAGDQVKKVAKSLAGEVVSLGILAGRVLKVLAGTLMTAGSLVGTLAGVVYVALAGTLASTGALVRKTAKRMRGIFTPGGALTKYVLNLLRTWKLKTGHRLTEMGAHHNWDMPRENRETREEDL